MKIANIFKIKERENNKEEISQKEKEEIFKKNVLNLKEKTNRSLDDNLFIEIVCDLSGISQEDYFNIFNLKRDELEYDFELE